MIPNFAANLFLDVVSLSASCRMCDLGMGGALLPLLIKMAVAPQSGGNRVHSPYSRYNASRHLASPSEKNMVDSANVPGAKGG